MGKWKRFKELYYSYIEYEPSSIFHEFFSELILALFSWVPTLLGVFLRMLFYKLVFKKIGFVGNITFGIKSKEISKIDIVVNYWKRMLKKTMILVYKIDRLKERKEHYFIRPLLERLVERYPDSW